MTKKELEGRLKSADRIIEGQAKELSRVREENKKLGKEIDERKKETVLDRREIDTLRKRLGLAQMDSADEKERNASICEELTESNTKRFEVEDKNRELKEGSKVLSDIAAHLVKYLAQARVKIEDLEENC